MILFYRDFQDFQLDLRHRRTLAQAAITADHLAPPPEPTLNHCRRGRVRQAHCLPERYRNRSGFAPPPLRGFAGPR